MQFSSCLLSITTSKYPVPYGASYPKMMFSEMPDRGSFSPKKAASSKISVVSSKVHFRIGPQFVRFIPCLVIAVKMPLRVIMSTKVEMCR